MSPQYALKILTRLGWTIGIPLALASCTYRIDKQNPAAEAAKIEGMVLGYNSLRPRVFAPRCIGCHGDSGGVSLETYESAKSVADRIRNEVLDEQSMPPTGPLDAEEQGLIRQWLDAGAPEYDVAVSPQAPRPVPSGEPSAEPSPEVEPSPSPSPTPLPSSAPSPTVCPSPAITPSPTATAPAITYALVRDRIFAAQCLRCHDPAGGKPRAGVSLDTYEHVVKFLSRIEKAALLKRTMPPRRPLSSDDQALLRDWIEAGAPH